MSPIKETPSGGIADVLFKLGNTKGAGAIVVVLGIGIIALWKWNNEDREQDKREKEQAYKLQLDCSGKTIELLKNQLSENTIVLKQVSENNKMAAETNREILQYLRRKD